ncbi:MAG: hypothetical protein JNL29_17220 [Nitrospira sp.]|nr:hypothetical protein [Nitrospira sp.]MBS0167439.1 hypothetical protein [Nitrospira sp.]
MTHSHNPSGWVVRNIFALVLATLGIGLELASRLSETFRRQVTRDLTIQLGSADGVAHHYVFSPRTVTSHRGSALAPTLSLCFDNAGQGCLILASPHAVGKVVHALLDGTVCYQGNAVLLLWFYGLTRFVLPIGRTGCLPVALPEGYLVPNLDSKVAGQIVHEPVTTELDPTWTLAHQQRAKMAMPRGSAGESVPLW